jgi:hypothetical protein
MGTPQAKLPEGWQAGEFVTGDALYADPPPSSDPKAIHVIGALEGDRVHRLFRIPSVTPVSELVTVFQVGSHGADSYGYDRQEAIDLVARNATEITTRIDSRITFADQAGLKIRFHKPITADELRSLESLFSENQMMMAGLENYLSEWDGVGPLLSEVQRVGLLHFWWD